MKSIALHDERGRALEIALSTSIAMAAAAATTAENTLQSAIAGCSVAVADSVLHVVELANERFAHATAHAEWEARTKALDAVHISEVSELHRCSDRRASDIATETEAERMRYVFVICTVRYLHFALYVLR